MTPMQKMKTISLLATLALLGCMDDDDSTVDTSSPFDYTLSSTYDLGAVNSNSFEVISSNTSCSKDQLEIENDTSTSSYSFAGDTLYLNSYDCKNAYTGGTKNQLSGTWTLVRSLPTEDSDYPEDCEMPVAYTEKVKFTSSSYTRAREVKNFCWGQTEGKYYSEDLPSDVAFKVIDCGTIQATDANKNVAQRILVSFDPSSRTAQWKVTYNGKSCSYANQEEEATKQICAERYAAFQKDGSEEYFDWYDWSEEELAYDNCVKALQVSDELEEFF